MFDRMNLPVMGNLVTEPEDRVIPGTDKQIVSFRLAVDHGYWDRDKKEEVKTGTTFLTVSCKGLLAQNVLASNYRTGTRLMVFGEFTTKPWTTKEGAERLDLKVSATDIGPSNLWTAVKVPEREGRGGGRQPAPQAAGHGSFNDGGQDWQPQYRERRQPDPQPEPEADPWSGGGWDTAAPGSWGN